MVVTRRNTKQIKNTGKSGVCVSNESTIATDSCAHSVKNTQENHEIPDNVVSDNSLEVKFPTVKREMRNKKRESKNNKVLSESEGESDNIELKKPLERKGKLPTHSKNRHSKLKSKPDLPTNIVPNGETPITKGNETVSKSCIKTRKRLFLKNSVTQESNSQISGGKKSKIVNDETDSDCENLTQSLQENLSKEVSKLHNVGVFDEGLSHSSRRSLKRSCNEKSLECEKSVIGSGKKVGTKRFSKVINSESENSECTDVKKPVEKLSRKELHGSESESLSESVSEWTEEECSESESEWEEQKDSKSVQKGRKAIAISPLSSESISETRNKWKREKEYSNGPSIARKRSRVPVRKAKNLSESDSEDEITNVLLSQQLLEKVKMEPIRKHTFSYNDNIKSTRDIAEMRLTGDIEVNRLDGISEAVNPKLALKTRLPDIKPILKYFGPYLPLGEASTSSGVCLDQLITKRNVERPNSAGGSECSVEKQEKTNSYKSSLCTSSEGKNKQTKGTSLQLSKLKKIKVTEDPGTSFSSQNGSDKNTSSEESDWEEVADAEQVMTLEDYNPEIPKDGIKITIGVPDPKKHRRKRRQDEFATYARRHINRFKKDTQIAMHKVHLLGFIANILYLNDTVLNDSMLKGIMLSLIPKNFLGITTKKTTSTLLKQMIAWFKSTFVLEKKDNQCESLTNLLNCASSRTVNHVDNYCYLFVVMGRVMKLDVRLCKSVYPITFKAPDLLKTKIQSGKSVDKTKSPAQSESVNNKPNRKSKASKASGTKTLKKTEEKTDQDVNTTPSINSSKKEKLEKVTDAEQRTSAKKSSRHSRATVVYSENLSEISDSKSDKDFKPAKKFVKSKPPRSKNNRKILSSDSDEEEVHVGVKNKLGTDNWAEVFLNAEQKWVSVDVVRDIVSQPYEIEANTSYSISYVLAIDNDSRIKDITQRYASNWLTQQRKERIDPDWWEEALEPFVPPRDKKDKDEDKQLNAMLMDQPLPKKIGE